MILGEWGHGFEAYLLREGIVVDAFRVAPDAVC